MTRTGKIARLPREIREHLNQRLQDGEQGKCLVDWLNSLPEAKAVMAREFGSRPISEQNLSEWKQGGYLDWLALQEKHAVVRGLVEQADELEHAAAGGAISERLSLVLTAELASQIQELLADTAEPARRWERLQEALTKLAQLRREESNAGRLQLEKERWQAKQKEVTAKVDSARALFPLHAVLLQHGFTQLIAEAPPLAQVAAVECLDHLLEKRRGIQARSHSGQPSQFKPNQGNSSNAIQADPTGSNQIKPNQAG